MMLIALEKYKQHTLFGDLWKRPGLNPRDRSIVMIAQLRSDVVFGAGVPEHRASAT